MAEIIRSPAALRDLDEIWDYIAQDNVAAADKLLRRIHERSELVAKQPFSGHTRPEFGQNIRCFIVGNYVVFYRPFPRGIEIIRVVHGARDIQEL